MDDIRVNLFQRNEGEVACDKSRLEATAVFENVFLRVPLPEAKIQYLLATEIAQATGPRAESVHQPGDFSQCGCLKNSQIAGLNFSPFP